MFFVVFIYKKKRTIQGDLLILLICLA